jgi:hypothetical protein
VAERPVERIVRQAGVPELVEILADRMAPTDLQTLLLDVYRRRTARLSAADLLAGYGANRFARPATLDPAALAGFEQWVWSLLPSGYQGVELSPLCPAGTSSVVATVDQNKVISTARNTEVVSDSTNVLALECAVRRRSLLRRRPTRFQPVRLAASQRQVRAQAFGGPREWSHFRIVGLVAAGRDKGAFAFEADAFRNQIGYFIALLGAVRREWQIDVAMTDLADHTDTLGHTVLAPLQARFPQAAFRMDPDRVSGRGYYVDACYKLFGVDESGTSVELADGGCTTWTRQLLSDQKERLVIGGMGVERILT